MITVWTKRETMQSVVLDCHIKVGRPVLPFRPTNAEWQKHFDSRVAANIARRAK